MAENGMAGNGDKRLWIPGQPLPQDEVPELIITPPRRTPRNGDPDAWEKGPDVMHGSGAQDPTKLGEE